MKTWNTENMFYYIEYVIDPSADSQDQTKK